MLTASVLNSDATLNNFNVISSVPFIPGEAVTLVIRLTQPQREDLRFVPIDEDATLFLLIPKKDGTNEEVEAEAMAGDHSIWSATLSSELTDEMTGGNFTFELHPTGEDDVIKGWVQNGLSLIVTGGDCC